MEFSLFNLMTMPQNGTTHSEVFAQMREMTRMADEAGFDVAWFAEHHLSNYSISPSPLAVAAHMAGHTKHIGVGPAVIVLPFYEPLRLIEEIFLVDQLSEGRLVLGLGTGYQPREFKKFGFEINDRLERGLEIWDVIDQGLKSGAIHFEGKHVKIKDAALSIAPYQKKIPVFAVGNAPEMRQRMVERDAVPLTTPGVAPDALIGTARQLYKETRAENGLSGDDFPFAVQRYIFVTDDKEEALRVANQVLIHARMAANMREAEPQMDGPFLKIVPFDKEPTIDEIMMRAIIGDAEHVTERIVDEVNRYGITHLSVFMQVAAIPYDRARKSLETFSNHVMPAVKSIVAQTKLRKVS